MEHLSPRPPLQDPFSLALSARSIARGRARHRQQEFLRFLARIERELPLPGLGRHRVLDNRGTHQAPKGARWFARHPRHPLRFTLTRASWLNRIERWWAKITRARIRCGDSPALSQPAALIHDSLEANPAHPEPLVWMATADLSTTLNR